MFEVKVRRLTIEPHPNADRLELAAVDDYRAVVAKGEFHSGDLAAYIPQDSICPDLLMKELGVDGKLRGSAKNRVGPVRLRGQLSQGLLYPVTDGAIRGRRVDEGDDVADLLGVTQWEPPVPTHMSGQVFSSGIVSMSYEIADVKRYPNAFRPGEQVVMTEKIHGTLCRIGWRPDLGTFVTSKGIGAKGMAFKLDAEDNESNVYVRAWRRCESEIAHLREAVAPDDDAVDFFGEVYGQGIQDLHYGVTGEKDFRLFDVYVGRYPSGRFLDYAEMVEAVWSARLDTVPELYRGPFSREALETHTTGRTTIGGGHVREGVVVKPLAEREEAEVGRLILKSKGEKFLLRKGATEYH